MSIILQEPAGEATHKLTKHAVLSTQCIIEDVQLADAENRGQKAPMDGAAQAYAAPLAAPGFLRSSCSQISSCRVSSPGGGVAARFMRLNVQAEQGQGLIE